MEQQIRKIEAELYNKPDDFQVSVARRQTPTYKPFIQRSSPGEFLMNPQFAANSSLDQASLEVLVADNGTSASLGPDQCKASHSTDTCQREHQQTPERLRIRYAPLIRTLEKVCKETLSNYHFWPNDRDPTERRTACAATILLRPWKLLVAYEKEIRDSIHDIDVLWKTSRREEVGGVVTEICLVENGEYHAP